MKNLLLFASIFIISGQSFATERTRFGEPVFEVKGKYVFERQSTYIDGWNTWIKITKMYIRNSGVCQASCRLN